MPKTDRPRVGNAPLTDFPLTIRVLLPDGRRVTVSAFCPLCGWRRRIAGQPAPGLQAFIGESGVWQGARFVAWMNPCGHVDTAESLRLEVAAQCASPGCVLYVSERCQPYCSPECCELASGRPCNGRCGVVA